MRKIFIIILTSFPSYDSEASKMALLVKVFTLANLSPEFHPGSPGTGRGKQLHIAVL